VRREVFLVENLHGPIKVGGAGRQVLPRATPLVVDDVSLGEVENLPSSLAGSKTEIQVLSVQKERFIQTTNLLQQLMSKQQKRPGDRLHFMDFIDR
jgi:hypothetical protein